jgi:hypothetical protein
MFKNIPPKEERRFFGFWIGCGYKLRPISETERQVMRMLDRASIEDAKVSAHYLDQIRRIQADIDAGEKVGKSPRQVLMEMYGKGPPDGVSTEKSEEATSTRSRRQGGPRDASKTRSGKSGIGREAKSRHTAKAA